MKESFENGQENDPAARIEEYTGREAGLFEAAYAAASEKMKGLVTGLIQVESLMTEVAVEDFVRNSEQQS
jgi:hypothetical protein